MRARAAAPFAIIALVHAGLALLRPRSLAFSIIQSASCRFPNARAPALKAICHLKRTLRSSRACGFPFFPPF